MRNITSKTNFIQRTLLFAMFVLMGYSSFAQVKTPFSPRFSDKVTGDFTMIANNVVSEHPTDNYNGADNNNALFSVFVDIDSEDTFNSSSANLVNPSPSSTCLSFRRAYLYWSAANKENGPDNNGNSTGNGQPEENWPFDQVKLMLPGASTYSTITADEVIYNGRAEHFVNDPYTCIKDITSEVQALANPYGKFQVANVKATVGDLYEHKDTGSRNTGTSGGWQIVFVYESPELKSRNITLFDGYANVTKDDNEFDVLFDGFLTVPTGQVNANIVTGAIEGDRSIVGDQLQIFDIDSNWAPLFTDERDNDNFFTSKITVNEAQFLNRNPASTNTLGFDASIFELRNNGKKLIDNNQTSAIFRMTSDQETYGLYLLGLSVEVFEPSLGALSFTTNVIGSNFDPGDNAPVEIRIKNVGNDNIENLEIAITLPPQVEFLSTEPLPTGVTYNFDAVTRELRFFVLDGNTDINSPEYALDFNLFINNECVTCSADIGLQALATFTGAINPNVVGTLSSGTVDDCGIGNHDPTYLHVTPVLSINDGSGIEGNNVVFNIASSHLLAEDAVLNLSYTNNTTSAGDYTVVNSYTVPIGTGNTSFGIPAIDDTIIEATEIFDIVASSAANITLLDNTAVGSIIDNDNAAPGDGISFTNATVAVLEGNTTADNNQLSFEVTYLGTIPTGETVSVDYTTVNGTAEGSDFVELTQTIQFTETSKSLFIVIDVIEDTNIENDEDFTLVLSNVTTDNGFVTGFVDGNSTNTAAGTLLNDDNAAPGDGISFTNATVAVLEGNTTADNNQVSFEVTYLGTIPAGETVSVDYTTVTGTADGTDFVETTTQTIQFTSTTTTQTIVVDIIEDINIENDEDFTLVLSNVTATNGFVTGFVDGNATNTATGNILNDDSAGTGDGISVSDFSINEDAGTVDFVITYTGPTVQDTFTVTFEITDGSAISPDDYSVAVAIGDVSFPANTSTGATQTVSITIIDDTSSENTEDLNITLSTISNPLVPMVDADGIGTIIDNDMGEIEVEPYQEEMTITCGEEIPVVPALVFSGGCGNYVVDYTETEQSASDSDDYIIVRTWNVTDSCGNTATFEQLIFIMQAETELVTIDICVEDLAIDLLDYLPAGFDTTGVFTVEDGGILNGAMFEPNNHKVGEYRITYAAEDTTCKFFADFTINVNSDCLPCDIKDLIVSKTITVNGDGINDYFEISGLESCGYVYQIMVFNRWGTKVYESDDYQNDWGGYAPNSSIGSAGILPTGTYYYMISLSNTEINPINGYIYIGSN